MFPSTITKQKKAKKKGGRQMRLFLCFPSFCDIDNTITCVTRKSKNVNLPED